MLQEYLPKLPAKCDFGGEVRPPPKKLLDQLKKGIQMRNRVAHVGGGSINSEVLQSVLEAVNDLLWLLDYYCGAAWAIEYVSPEIKAELGVRPESAA